MEVLKSENFKKPVIFLKIYKEDDTVLVIDNETTVRFLDLETLKLKDGFKAGIKHQDIKVKGVDYSNDKKFLATLSADSRESRLYNTKTKKLVAKMNRHQGEVSCVKIDPDNRFMLSGGEDGKIFAVDVSSGKLMFTLPSHVDTINEIAFSANSNWVATASYDRKISLFNLVTMTHKGRLRSHSAPVMHIRFFQKHKLLSIDKNAKGIIWDVHKAKVTARLQGIHDDVRHLCMSDDEKFLFLGTALGYVIVFDLESYEMIASRYIKIASPVTSMEFDGARKHLVVGTEDGFLMFYDIFEGLDAIKELMRNKKFDAIQQEVKKNPLLKYTEIYDLISNLWERSFEKAKLFLEHRQPDKAKLILNQFKDVPGKNKHIQKLFQDFSQYDKFVNFAKAGKLSLAYSLANSYPVYKDTKIYAALEKQWKADFSKAQKMMLNPRTSQMAKDLLVPYRGIAEKTKYIQELMAKSNVYKRFLDALGKRDFKLAIQLVKQNSFLKQLPEYTTLMSFADNIYIKSHEAIAKNDFNTALKNLSILVMFDDFKEEAQEKLKEIEQKQRFYLAIKSNNVADAYDALAEYDDLLETPEGRKLQQQWNEAANIANTYASNGDILGVKKALEQFMNIPSKYPALATIFSWAYISQLERALNEKQDKHTIERGIKNYLSFFGLTEQIEVFFDTFKEQYGDVKLKLEALKKGDISSWRPSMIVKSILD